MIIFVMNKGIKMNLFEFTERFPNEQACKNHLRKARQKQGIVCSKCCNDHHFYMENAEKWQCYNCGSRIGLKSGTIMYKSKLSVLSWYKCMHLMTAGKHTYSALEIQRQIKEKSHSAVWFMMQKIRVAMGTRDKLYKLKNEVELDEGFFRIVPLTNEQDSLGETVKVDKFGEVHPCNPKNKAGKGSPYQRAVLVMVESKATGIEKPHDKGRIMGYCKMVALDAVTINGIKHEVSQCIDSNATVISDNSTSYDFADLVKQHTPTTVTGKYGKNAVTVLPWVHTVISNAKKKFLGVFHSVSDRYLQNYLNEFVYKLNRRTFTQRDSFDGVMEMAIAGCWNS